MEEDFILATVYLHNLLVVNLKHWAQSIVTSFHSLTGLLVTLSITGSSLSADQYTCIVLRH